ncbi:uncharacterized protein LOC106701982 [Latimeria chalumnae]|uniref:uncharacterized protein LOC106701982 n=1 Tax=Latimeria chalumnae TaxID=7897 RepID=UPI0006D8E17F|nr:PREDICTED: uncharacterized protein C1orf189 homolog [Latimeria chalumnae]|eukprot:XP_014339552.1 PREDICTED: uncharacterized protein C1orf189 homolog [Latimeria chalumnae]
MSSMPDPDRGDRQLYASLLKEEERIRLDELFASRNAAAKQDNLIRLRADWVDSVENLCTSKIQKRDMCKIKEELHYARNAFVLVRRAALKQMLELEFQQYRSELALAGKAFFTQRL